MPRKVFVAGEILTAADVNTNLMDQSVMVFDDASARTTAIPTPVEGMVTYLSDTDAVEKFDGDDFVAVTNKGIGSNVVQTVKTDTFSTSAAGTFADITGLTATITPSTNTSKILVCVYINLSNTTAGSSEAAGFRILRDSTAVFLGAPDGLKVATSGGFSQTASNQQIFSYAPMFLDSPATTSAITYKIDLRAVIGTAVVNRTGDGGDFAARWRVPSSITLIEVAG